MSHFQIYLITEEKPTEELIKERMLPYHEFECTGIEEYVQEIDITQDILHEWQNTKTLAFISPNGKIYSAYIKQFKRPKEDGFGYEYVCPEGWTEQELLLCEVYSTLVKCLREYYDYPIIRHGKKIDDKYQYQYVLLDENEEIVKIIRRTNPNAKWDGYQVGGCFGGEFLVYENARELAEQGAPSPLGSNQRQTANIGYDIVCRKHMDFEAMRALARREREEAWQIKLEQCLEKTDCENEEEVLHHWRNFAENVKHATNMWEKARESNNKLRRWDYWYDNSNLNESSDGLNKSFVQALESGIPQIITDPFFGLGIDEDNPDIKGWIKDAPPFSTYAIIHPEFGWKAMGEMGWFGMSNDEYSSREWDAEVVKLIENLPNDYWVAAIDCHI